MKSRYRSVKPLSLFRAQLSLETLEERVLLSSTPLPFGPQSYDPSDILVRFQPGGAAPKAEDYLPGSRISDEIAPLLVPGLRVVYLPQGVQVEDAIQTFEHKGGVAYAAPNFIIQADATTPNDPGFSSLWGLNNTGQGGTPDADIDAPEAWDINRGSGRIVVADIDTGIDYTHQDLYLNSWINQGEIPTQWNAGPGLTT